MTNESCLGGGNVPQCAAFIDIIFIKTRKDCRFTATIQPNLFLVLGKISLVFQMPVNVYDSSTVPLNLVDYAHDE